MVRLLLAMVLLCITAHAPAQTAAGAPAGAAPVERTTAGKVDLVEGNVRFLDRNLRSRRPAVGDPIYEGESIVTGADGEVHLQMDDGGYIAVRPATKMRIATFRAQGDAEDRSVIGLLEGSFRSVTGWIAKAGRDRVVVRTPTATIGVRGTEHEPLVIPEGSKVGEPGTYDRVHAGETEIRTQQGAVSVRPNQAGFVPRSGALRPRVLDRVPEFFRPTRNEARFSGLHDRVTRQLDQRRDERRKLVEERRKVQLERRDKGKSDKTAGGKGGAQLERKGKGERSDRDKADERRRPDQEQKGKAEGRGKGQQEHKGKADKQEREEHRKADKREHAKGGK